MKKQNYINILKIILFAPLTLYLGERSPVAFDEGFYILQSRWILLSNDWISPMYWGNLVLDRTNGIQILFSIISENIWRFKFRHLYSKFLRWFSDDHIH